jgi:O-antigen/teichoic acid export membrane protein
MIFKSALIIFLSNALAHLINYSYHFIAGHFLTPDQFGLLESFVSLNYFIAVLISSFSLSIIHQLNLTKTSQKPALIQTLQSFSLKLTLIIWLFVLLTFPLLKRLLHFNNPYLLIVFSVQILFSFLPTLYLSLLQAKLKFKEFSLINIIAPLTKALLALTFFLLGLKLLGALTAMSLAGLIPALFSFYLVKKHLPNRSLTSFWSTSRPPARLPRSFIRFGLLAFITNLSLTSLYNSDVLLVRFFISHQSGLYSAASVLTKIIFFASASVLTVAFPVFSLQLKNLQKLKNSFHKSLFLISTIAFLGVIVYQLYPHLIIKLFSNNDYLQAANLLPGFSLFIFFFTILNLLTQLLLVLNQRLAMITAFSTALLQLTLIFISHQNLFQIISASIIATITGLILTSTVIIKKLYVKT